MIEPKEKRTPSSIVKFIGFTLVVLFVSQWSIALLHPDQDQSGKRMLMASKQSGLALRLYADVGGLIAGDPDWVPVRADWKEGHRLFNEQFPAAVRSAEIESRFSELNSAFYRIEEELDNKETVSLAVLAQQTERYSKAADRIFLAESSAMNVAMKRHTGIVIAVNMSGVALIFGFFFFFTRRQLKKRELEVEAIQEAHVEALETSERLKKFMLTVVTGFSSDLATIQDSALSHQGKNDFCRLQRTARSAKVFSEFLLEQRPNNEGPFSLDALLQDVSDYLTMNSEFSPASVAFEVVSKHRSAQGNTDLIGSMLSQLLIVLLELPSALKVNVKAEIEPSTEERAKLSFVFEVEPKSQSDLRVLGTAIKHLPEQVNEHFGMAMVDGIVKMLNARLWLKDTRNDLPQVHVSLTCDAYEDEVAFDDTAHLTGKRVFVLDSQTENLRTLVKQLSGYGIQATPFNSLLPIIENPTLLSRFDGGVIVHREELEDMGEFVQTVRHQYRDDELPLLAVYPDEKLMNSGIAWDALLAGQNTEAELLSALAFCMLPASRREAESTQAISSSDQPSVLQRANR